MYHQFVPQPLHHQADALIAELNRLNDKPNHCPYCQHQVLYTVNAQSGNYRCKACKKGFNRSTGTPYYRLAPLACLPLAVYAAGVMLRFVMSWIIAP